MVRARVLTHGTGHTPEAIMSSLATRRYWPVPVFSAPAPVHSTLVRSRQALCVAASLALIALLARGANACTDVSGSITGNVTWGPTGSPADTCYRVTSSVSVGGGGTLTIQPGTHVYFEPGTRFIVSGGFDTYGTVTAIGTAAMPIVFAAMNGQIGGWQGILIYHASVNFQHCIFRDGGEAGHSQVIIDDLNGRPKSITNCVIERHAATGVSNHMRITSSPILNGCTFRNFGGFPVSATLPHAQGVFASNTFVPSASRNAVELRSETPYGTSVGWSVTLSVPPAGFCYSMQPTGTSLLDGNSITTLAGTLIKSTSGIAGILHGSGTVFTSFEDDTLGDTNGDGPSIGAPGQWYGILLRSGGTLSGCRIRFAGRAGAVGSPFEPPLQAASLQLAGGGGSNNVIEKGANVGVYALSSGSFSGNLVRDHARYNVAAPPRWYQQYLGSNTFAPSGSGTCNAYEVFEDGTTQPGAILPVPPAGFCYAIEERSGRKLTSVNSLTIQPGTLLKFKTGTSLAPTSNVLSANGAIFTSMADDTLGDTGGDGPTSGGPGQWVGVDVGMASWTLANIRIRFAGAGGGPSLTVRGSGPVVTGCSVERGLGPALLSVAKRIPDLVAANTFVPSATATFNAYELIPGTVDVDVDLPAPALPFCYLTKGIMTIGDASDPALTLASGTVVKLGPLGELQVGGIASGRLEAEGVIFTSVADDTLGDTGGDGPTSGEPGQWRTIQFLDHDSGSILRCSTIRHGGGSIAGLVVRKSSPLIQNCTIRSVSIIGAHVSYAESRPVFYECTFATDLGIVVSDSEPVVYRCDFSSTPTAIEAFGTASVHAENCWWGSASGPEDSSPGPPDANPSGTGVYTSDQVDYRPWLEEAPTIVCPTTTTDVTPPVIPTSIAVERLALLGISPNPGAPPWRVRFAAPSAGAARIDVYDVAGRRLGGRDLVVSAPGVHQAEVEMYAPLRPSVCLVVLTLAGRSVTTRVAVVR